MADVFISYASADRDKAEELAHLLEARRWTVWWDRQIALGLSFDEAIERELLACRCAIVLWTAGSVGSKWVRREARAAARREVLVPIRAAAVEPPLEFTDLQTADLSSWEHVVDQPEFEKILRRIEELAPRSPASTSLTGVGTSANGHAWKPPGVEVLPQPPTRTASDVGAAIPERTRASFMRSRRAVAAVVAIAALGLAGGGVYWIARSASTRTAQRADPNPSAAETRPAELSKLPPPHDAASEKKGMNPTDAPVTEGKTAERAVTLPAFHLSIDQPNYFSVKEFTIPNLDLTRDFLVSFDVKSTRMGGSTRYGIAWNYRPDDYLLFTLHSTDFGYYSIGAGRSESGTPFARFSQGAIGINAERDFDAIQLRKRGDDLIFLVNDREVWRTREYRLRSNKFAFWVADYSDAVMRSYTVRQ